MTFHSIQLFQQAVVSTGECVTRQMRSDTPQLMMVAHSFDAVGDTPIFGKCDPRAKYRMRFATAPHTPAPKAERS